MCIVVSEIRCIELKKMFQKISSTQQKCKENRCHLHVFRNVRTVLPSKYSTVEHAEFQV